MNSTRSAHGATSLTHTPPRFRIIEHVVDCQHTREYATATANGDDDVPKLVVKQYIPLSNPNPKPGDVTIIGGHANGFPKEMYEPLWDEIEQRTAPCNFRIRAIWIADIWNQGQSGVANEDVMGKDPSWFDHSRDLLYLINQKQEQMPHPIVGIGHSVGGTQLAYLSLIHPRLLNSLVLLDPVIQIPENAVSPPAINSTFRRDVWPSYEVAKEKFLTNSFYQSLDPRVLDLWIQHGLRPVPTATIPSQGRDDKRVTLTTTKHQEVTLYLRPTFTVDDDHNGAKPESELPKDLDTTVFHNTQKHPFYRPEPTYVFQRLPELRPNVLYIHGKDSTYCNEGDREKHLYTTGVGVGGSGGVAAGGVENVLLHDCGHLLPFEKVGETADFITAFLERRLENWRKEEARFRDRWMSKSKLERATVDKRWEESIDPRGPKKTKL